MPAVAVCGVVLGCGWLCDIPTALLPPGLWKSGQGPHLHSVLWCIPKTDQTIASPRGIPQEPIPAKPPFYKIL